MVIMEINTGNKSIISIKQIKRIDICFNYSKSIY